MMSQPQRIPMVGSVEYDAFTSWRHVLYWKPGERKAAKRKYHRRWRKQVKANLLCATYAGSVEGK